MLVKYIFLNHFYRPVLLWFPKWPTNWIIASLLNSCSFYSVNGLHNEQRDFLLLNDWFLQRHHWTKCQSLISQTAFRITLNSWVSTFSISCCLVVTEFVFLLPQQHIIKPLRSLPNYHKDVMCSRISHGDLAAGIKPNFNR
jgi:hypothetical protein